MSMFSGFYNLCSKSEKGIKVTSSGVLIIDNWIKVRFESLDLVLKVACLRLRGELMLVDFVERRKVSGEVLGAIKRLIEVQSSGGVMKGVNRGGFNGGRGSRGGI